MRVSWIVGSTFSHTFERPGTFAYVCVLHPGHARHGRRRGRPAAPRRQRLRQPASAASATSGPVVDATIIDFAFQPLELQVAAGSTITWTNTGEYPHTVTADDASFDSEILLPTKTFSVTLTQPGTYTYHCNIHKQDMTATIVVTVDPGQA